MSCQYIIISPARNEEKHIEKTINSVINQTKKPKYYVIVNDGSTDNTSAIINRFAAVHDWIKEIKLSDRGFHKYGSGVMEAFYTGLNYLRDQEYDFVVKLDCDLSFNAYYFEDLFKEFHADEKLGIASGQTFFLNPKGELIWEDAPLDHTRGPSKVYRKQCFEEIGGLKISLGWDNMDEVTARMKGWTTRSFKEYQLVHHRQLGSNIGIIKGNIRHGYTDYITGYSNAYFILKTFYRLFSKPFFIGSLASFYGYYRCYFIREPRAVDREFRKYYQKEQISKLWNPRFWNFYLEKYNVPWRITSFLCWCIFFSGIHHLYIFYRKKVKRNYNKSILTYHKICSNSPSDITVSTENFSRQMRYLSKNYKVVTLAEILKNRKDSKPSQDLLAITFDDGYADNYVNAFPILKENKLPATIFLVSNHVNRDGCLTEAWISEMQKESVVFGSHTCNHPILSQLKQSNALSEVTTSKHILEVKLKQPVDYFAYPKGKSHHFNDAIAQMVQQTGYKAAFTMMNGNIRAGTNIYKIPRLGVRDFPLYVFKVRISGILESSPFLFVRKVFKLL
jgi:biofilm PGA synthesis N-glycosyltransferase PgaC